MRSRRSDARWYARHAVHQYTWRRTLRRARHRRNARPAAAADRYRTLPDAGHRGRGGPGAAPGAAPPPAPSREGSPASCVSSLPVAIDTYLPSLGSPAPGPQGPRPAYAIIHPTGGNAPSGPPPPPLRSCAARSAAPSLRSVSGPARHAYVRFAPYRASALPPAYHDSVKISSRAENVPNYQYVTQRLAGDQSHKCWRTFQTVL